MVAYLSKREHMRTIRLLFRLCSALTSSLTRPRSSQELLQTMPHCTDKIQQSNSRRESLSSCCGTFWIVCAYFRRLQSMWKKQKGGRPAKGRKRRGRPTSGDAHTTLLEVQRIAPPSFFPEMSERSIQHIPASLGLNPSDVECPICLELLDRPIQILCGSVICMTGVQR